MSMYAANQKPIYQGIYHGIYGQSSVAADPLVFHALTHAGASGGTDAAGNTLLPFEGVDVLTGIGTLTEARTSQNFSPDHEGIWRSWGSGEAVREGWRQVENLCLYSEDFSNAVWSKYATATVTGTNQINLPAVNDRVSNTSIPPVNTGDSRVFSVTLWGSGTVSLAMFFNGAVYAQVTLTSTPTRYCIAATASGDDTTPTCAIVRNTGDTATVVYANYAQCEATTGRSSTTNPSEYCATDGSSVKKYFASTNPWEVTSNVATATATVTELTDIWTVGSPAHTNSLPYSLPSVDQWSLTEGSAGDLVTNGDFATDLSGWTAGTGWSWGAAGVASCDGTQTGTSLLWQVMGMTPGNLYKITFTLSNYSAGACKPETYGTSGDAGTSRSANGTYSEYLISGSNGAAGLTVDADFIGDIDNVIVQPAVIESYTTGLTGVSSGAQSAVVLTDDDGAAYEYVRYNNTIPDDSNTNVVRVFVKKDNDETRFAGIQFFCGDGTAQRNYITLNTKTGELTTESSLGTVDQDSRLAGEWWEVLVSVQNNSSGNLSGDILIFPARGTVAGTASTAATGSITVANCELHLNTTIAAVRGSSPIYTNSAAASTVANDDSYDDANHPTEGGYFIEWTPQYDTAEVSGNIELISLDNNAGVLFYDADNSLLKSTDGTNTASVALTIVEGTTYKCWVAYGGTSLQVGVNATTGTAGTFDGAFASGTKIEMITPSVATNLVRNMRAYSADFATVVPILQGLAV